MPDPVRRPVALLVNPIAGGKLASGPPLADEAELHPHAVAARMRDAGLEVECHALTPDDDPGELARASVARGADAVVGGGDGTVGRVAAELVGTDATLGILAMGSFNNIARGLGLPSSLDEAVAAVARGEAVSIDVGAAVRGEDDLQRLFFEAAGVGIDAVGFGAVQLTTRHGLRRGLRAAWRALRWRRRRMLIDLDGRLVRTAALLVTVSNGPYYGFGFTVGDAADPRDGQFEVSIFRRMSKLDLVRHFLAVARGRRQYEPRIQRERAARVDIRGLHRALPAHADGQLIGTTPVQFVVLPGALRVFR